MSTKAPLILFYTRFFDTLVDAEFLGGDFTGRWTVDRRRIAEADAVVFHIPNRRELGDARKYPGQCWVAWSMESTVNFPQFLEPAFMKPFDLTMTYEVGSDVWVPYLPPAASWRDAQARPIPPKTQEALAVLFQSSGINRSGRESFAADLFRHIKVDSYGRFMKNRSIEGPDLGPETKIATIGGCKFCLAFEN